MMVTTRRKPLKAALGGCRSKFIQLLDSISVSHVNANISRSKSDGWFEDISNEDLYRLVSESDSPECVTSYTTERNDAYHTFPGFETSRQYEDPSIGIKDDIRTSITYGEMCGRCTVSSRHMISVANVIRVKSIDITSIDTAVILYTADWCGYCHTAELEFKKIAKKYRSVPFYIYDIPEDRRDIVPIASDLKALPSVMVIIDGVPQDILHGWSSSKVTEILETIVV